MTTTAERRYQSWKPSRAPAMADQPESGQAVFFLLALFTIILFGRPTDLIRVRIPMAEMTAIAAIIGYLIAKLNGKLPWVITTEVKLVIALTFWFLLTVPFAIWKGGAVEALSRSWFKTLIIFFLLSQTVSSVRRVRTLLLIIVWCEFFVTAYAIAYLRMHGGVAPTTDDRFYGATVGFVSGNYLGIAAGITFPYMIVLLTRKPGVIRVLLILATMALMMWNAVLTASRSGFMAIGVCLVLSWFLLLGRARARWVGIIFVLGAVLAAALAPPVFWERMETLWKKKSELQSETSTSAAQSTQVRELALKNSIKWTLENPVFGLGFGCFHIKSGEAGGARQWIETHNGYTQVSSETGIPGLILFVSLLVTAVKRMRVISRLPADDPKAGELAMWARATLVALLSFMFGILFAHLSYDYYVYYLIGIGIALQMVYKREFLPAPAAAKKTAPALQESPGW